MSTITATEGLWKPFFRGLYKTAKFSFAQGRLMFTHLSVFCAGKTGILHYTIQNIYTNRPKLGHITDQENTKEQTGTHK